MNPTGGRLPRLSVAWESRADVFRSNLREAFRSHPIGRGVEAATSYFRHSFVPGKFPGQALAASAILHTAMFLFPFPPWTQPQPRAQLAFPRIEVTWYVPPRDLPAIAPRARAAAPAKKSAQQKPQVDAFHPRQTIVSRPMRPNHPRQTLIQPEAPPAPPTILPALPNIVQWMDTPQPPRPQLRINPDALRRLRPRQSAPRRVAEVAAPEVRREPGVPDELRIAQNFAINPAPQMPLVPEMVPRGDGGQVTSGAADAAPEISPNNPAAIGGDGVHRLIALSATPAMPAPEIRVPAGNLMANISISPEGPSIGPPGGTGNGSGTGEVGVGTGGGSNSGTGTGGGSGPPGIRITGGDPSVTSPVAGPASGAPAPPLVLKPLPARPTPRTEPVQPGRAFRPDITVPRVEPGPARPSPGSPPEQALSSKKTYTLYVNMPNLTSFTGSWILTFAELPEGGSSAVVSSSGAGELISPMPIRKVDPRYPPALMDAGIQGEVVLYAIIRRDGSVDSIQVLRGLDPELDRNAAEALARWQFRPGGRDDGPVDVEAVIRIPFRLR